MVIALVAYIAWQYLADRDRAEELLAEIDEHQRVGDLRVAWLLLLGGFVGVALGAEFLVRGSSVLAGLMGVPESVVGLTVVAFGTSLPELATCVAAAMKRHTDVIIGNIVGSNVFNILFILGVTSIVIPIPVPEGFGLMLQAILVAVTLGLAAWLLIFARIGRLLGLVGVVLYLAFVIWQYQSTLPA